MTGLWSFLRTLGIVSALSLALASQLSAVEGDFDNDAIPDEIDADSDNDGLPNIQEGLVDSDNDGWPDFLDLDSDNDTIPDLLETILDRSVVNAIDADLNGQVDPGVDLGGNGFANQLELQADSGSINFQIPDADADGIPNLRDLDSDNDGLSDRLEYRNDSSFQFAQIDTIVDGNQNGIDDTILPITAFFDIDGDGFENAFDLDSDNDGLSDLLETAGTGLDSDNNGQIDGFIDDDGNGLHDPLQGAPLQFTDTDNDGFANQLDLDSDNDGLTDAEEIFGAAPPAAEPPPADEPPQAVEPGPSDDGTVTDSIPVTPVDSVANDEVPQPTVDDTTGLDDGGPTIITTGVDGSVGGCSIAGSSAAGWGSAIQWLLMLLFCATPKLLRSFSRPA